MVSMVDTYAHDLFLNELLRNLFVSDLFALHKKKYLLSVWHVVIVLFKKKCFHV